MARPRRGAAQSRRVATVVALVVAVGLPSLGVLVADPPCELEADTLSGHEGATMHEYAAGTAKHNYCHLAHNYDGHLCVIPDNEGCEIDCDVGYGDSSPGDTNQLYCNYPGTGDPVLQFDFTCTGELLSQHTPLPRPAATRDDHRDHLSKSLISPLGSLCTACDEQSYKAAKGNVACTPCPGGNGTGKTGATSADECSVCGPGEDGSPCRPCAVGTWKEVSGAGSCSLCPEGKTTASRGARRESQCSICTAGYGGAACDPCAVGRYKASNGTHECTPCPGRTSTSAPGAKAASDCDTCERGYEGPPSCQPVTCAASAPLGHHGGCPQGQYGGDDCTVTCATGYVAQAGSGLYTCNATDAGAGTWIPADGAETALACDEAPAARCPDSSAVFPIDPSSGCNTVHIVSVVSPDSAESGDTPRYKHWRQGLELFRDHVNSQGGLRMGEGFVGYVNVTMHTVEEEAEQERHYRDLYLDLCQAADVDVMIGPLDSTIALNVLRHLKANHCNKLFLLASSGIDLVFTQGFTHAWSVYGKASQRGSDVIAFLDGLGDTSQSKTVAIAGESTELTREWLGSLTDAIDAIYDISVVNTPDLAVRLKHQIQLASEEKPTIFIGLGDAFESLLSEFKLLKYAPAAAFLAGGLDVSNYTAHQSCTRRKQDDCLVYDQWLGTVPWSPDMKHAADTDWSGKPDKYSDSTAGPGGGDRRYTRYMGSVSDFVKLSKDKLASTPTHYHAQAAATLLMMQMAVELTPGGEGWGLTFDEFRTLDDATKVKDAMKAYEFKTFWGPISLGDTGENSKFEMGVAQLQKDASTPVLVGPASFEPDDTAVFPAKWPCELRGSCDKPPEVKPAPPILDHILNPKTEDFLILGGVVVALIVLGKCVGCKYASALLYVAGSIATAGAFAASSAGTGQVWDVVCISVTIGTSFLVPSIVRRFKSKLEAHNVNVPDGSDTIGWFGLLMFLHGIVDLLADINLCVTLFSCARYGLAGSALGTLLLSIATTLFLAFSSLQMIQRNNREARDWYVANGTGATFVILMSCCRIESMAILRLRLCGKDIINYPMAPQHFHFLRYSGWFHAILADIPHLLVP